PRFNTLTLLPCLVFILFYLDNVQTDPHHSNPFQEEADKVFANFKTNKHIFLLGKNNFSSVSHTGSLHASVPVMAITQPT
ncbi:MAG: hypothetical protein WC341_11650, partial [Bacteroidales bacterium]